MVSAASREAWKRALWWVPVLAAIHDCLGSVHWVQRGRQDAELEDKGRQKGAAGSSGGSERSSGSLAGEALLVERLSPRLYKFRRGDIVLLRSPEEPHIVLIRRLIGLEGDWVAVPGEAKVEKIQMGRCWVEGDYDGRAKGDSRKFGAVPLALVQGSAAWVCWPPSRWGPVGSVLPPGRVIAQGGFSAAAPGLDGMDDDW